MPNAPTRRALDLRDFDSVLAEVESLRSLGYNPAGKWNLAQTLDHLADWMNFGLDGYPPQPAPVRFVLFLLRSTVGPGQLRKVLATRVLPAGGPTMPQTVPPPDRDANQAVERFRRTIERIRNNPGPFQPSPLFGPLDPETYRQLHLIHCSHHLGFLLPKSA
jgi:hypothetical protein